MAKVFANSGDADQMPQIVASDLGLHCLPVTLLGDGLKCIQKTIFYFLHPNICCGTG